MCTSHDVDNNTESNDPRDGYQLDSNWPEYPLDMQFEMGSGIAVDKKGIVYLFTRDLEHWATHPLAMKDKMGKSSISMFTREGQYLGKWGPSDEQGFALGAHTLYIEKDGMFWTTDRDGHTVKKYTPEGELLLTLGTFESGVTMSLISTVRLRSSCKRTVISSSQTDIGTPDWCGIPQGVILLNPLVAGVGDRQSSIHLTQ